VTRIVLASRSPRRQELLRALGLEFDTVPADVDERPLEGEAPNDMVARLSEYKARGGGVQAATGGDVLVIAADTVVVLGDVVLGKPRDADENRAFLRRLEGRDHRVVTGHTLVRGDASQSVVVGTRVRFRALDEGEIARYVATGEGLDKAGGYAIQGRGSALVSGIDGCYFNVVGLSVPAVVEASRRLGVPLV
jgi:septum formation protein